MNEENFILQVYPWEYQENHKPQTLLEITYYPLTFLLGILDCPKKYEPWFGMLELAQSFPLQH